ncbi:MAG TPA: hypothetical protein VJT82_06610 [Pyrinomonadaceae bacterium]|nr:hypothetical protein [Pyrinomonadaceae bacterium]
MEKETFVVGARVDKVCVVCGVERGHIVTSVGKRNQITRVTCSNCGTLSSFKLASRTPLARSANAAARAAYDPKRTYRTGQTMLHPSFGEGEVTSVVEPRKIDVLFTDRLRRLVHAQV